MDPALCLQAAIALRNLCDANRKALTFSVSLISQLNPPPSLVLGEALLPRALKTAVLKGLEHYEEEEESSDSEEDIKLLQMEEAHVRDMALGDWARAQIFDGHWISSADTWYHHTMNGYKDYVPAVHPCSWMCSPSSDSGQDDETGVHPLPSTLKGTIPPTFGLCEQAFSAHQC